MNCTSNVIDKFVKRSKKTEELSKSWGDNNSDYGVPDEKSDNGMFSNCAFFPGDFGMRKISNNSGNGGSDKVGKPDEVIIFNNQIRQNCKKGIIESGD